MTIFGIGTDIVDITRIESALKRNNERFRNRILHPDELAEPNSSKASFVAKRFAAKEATAKALGEGIRGIVAWKQIIIRHDNRGMPFIQCIGELEEWRRRHNLRLHLSLTDERLLAAATVIAEEIPSESK